MNMSGFFYTPRRGNPTSERQAAMADDTNTPDDEQQEPQQDQQAPDGRGDEQLG